MSLTLNDIERLSKLAQLDLTEQQSAVDTSGVAPLSHPIAVWRDELSLRLREDKVTETNRRDAYQKPAPSVQDGLYLVPKVIE